MMTKAEVIDQLHKWNRYSVDLSDLVSFSTSSMIAGTLDENEFRRMLDIAVKRATEMMEQIAFINKSVSDFVSSGILQPKLEK